MKRRKYYLIIFLIISFTSNKSSTTNLSRYNQFALVFKPPESIKISVAVIVNRNLGIPSRFCNFYGEPNWYLAMKLNWKY